MAKSIEEFNKEFEYRFMLNMNEAVDIPRRSKFKTIMSTIIFYFVIASMVFAAFFYSQRNASKNILGYAYFNILTTSMQSEMPAGSFILVKAVDGNSIKVGDDITFFQSESIIVTHRVIGILKNYEDSGQLGFQTMGIDNPMPDKDVTYEGNVIGKVVFHIPVLGFALEYIAANIVMVLTISAILVLLIYFVRVFFRKDYSNENNSNFNKKYSYSNLYERSK